MFKKRIFMMSAAALIVLFIGWFYIKQLGLIESVPKEMTSAAEVEGKDSYNNGKNDEAKTTIVKTDSQGTVSIQAILLPEKRTSNQLVFRIAMNTHSGNLLQFEIDKLAELDFGSMTNTDGKFEWELTSEDSHHIVGYLTWNGKVKDDQITLKLKNIDNISLRTFIWDKNEL